MARLIIGPFGVCTICECDNGDAEVRFYDEQPAEQKVEDEKNVCNDQGKAWMPLPEPYKEEGEA